jgi:hypothetical protein
VRRGSTKDELESMSAILMEIINKKKLIQTVQTKLEEIKPTSTTTTTHESQGPNLPSNLPPPVLLTVSPTINKSDVGSLSNTGIRYFLFFKILCISFFLCP